MITISPNRCIGRGACVKVCNESCGTLSQQGTRQNLADPMEWQMKMLVAALSV